MLLKTLCSPAAAAMVQGPRDDLPRLADGEVRLAQVWFIVSGLTSRKGVSPESPPDSVLCELTRLLDGTRCRISLSVLQKTPPNQAAAQAFAIAQNAICELPSSSVVEDLSINNCFSHALLRDPVSSAKDWTQIARFSCCLNSDGLELTTRSWKTPKPASADLADLDGDKAMGIKTATSNQYDNEASIRPGHVTFGD